MNLAPIIVFTYQRKIDKLIESLLKNKLVKDSELYIFSDGFKNEIDRNYVLEARARLKNIVGFKSINIIEAPQNKGLANSIIDGVTEIINKYEKVIILEDDLIVSSDFLEYMNDALNFYRDDEKIWSISGYGPNLPCLANYVDDLYLSVRGSSWGWATWKDRWGTIDWEVKDFNKLKQNKDLQNRFNLGGNDMFKMLELQMLSKIDSWAIRWCYSQFKQNTYTVYPTRSKVINDGFNDNLGVHNNNAHNKLVLTVDNTQIILKKLHLDDSILKCFQKYHDLNIQTTIGYFLKKYGGYSLIRELYYAMQKK